MGIHEELIAAKQKEAELLEQTTKAYEMLAAHYEREGKAVVQAAEGQRRKDAARERIRQAGQLMRIESVDRLLGGLSLEDIAHENAADPIGMQQLRALEVERRVSGD